MPRFHTLMLVIAFLLQTVLPTAAQAQQAPELVLADKSDVRIIVDISGSMKNNDPENLRQPAVRLLAEMLPSGSTAGLWTFGQYVNMLVPHREVTEQWRAVAREKSAQINSVASEPTSARLSRWPVTATTRVVFSKTPTSFC
ncbi:vWA domain-containing protein [Marinobacter similis]|uniref:hypothetical protein n=1 Tax=Marinobacter similis TaxID=1420916 RepID=UPI0011DD1606|nr:hypothetical protein [Marinobacter similis]